MEGNSRLKIDWASLIVGSKFTVFALFYFVFEGNFPSTSPRGAYIWRGDLTEGFLRYEFGGLIFGGLIHGGAYFGILGYSMFTSHRFPLVSQLHRCPLRAAVCSQSGVFVPVHQKAFWLLLRHYLWYSDAYTGWFIVPCLWSVVWKYELCVCLVCYTFHPDVAPSIRVICENLAVHCEVLLRSTVPVMWKDFLQHNY